jgi:hypothetical protein
VEKCRIAEPVGKSACSPKLENAIVEIFMQIEVYGFILHKI